MTIETNESTTADKRRAALAKAREAKAAKKALSFQSEDPDALNKRRAELLAELAELPDPAPAPADNANPPGAYIKDGMGPDKIPWTPALIRDACNNGAKINGHTFGWVNVIGDPRFPTLSWNGIVYWFFAGKENKIPNVHYAVYKTALEDAQREQEKWSQPANQPVFDGYMSPPHQFSTAGPLEPREG